jgi:transposase
LFRKVCTAVPTLFGQLDNKQPDVKFVALKTDAQQVVLSLHRIRSQLMNVRIMQTNAFRGLLYEFGIVLPEGQRALLVEVPAAIVAAKIRLPAVLRCVSR